MIVKEDPFFLKAFSQGAVLRGKDYFSRGLIEEYSIVEGRNAEFFVAALVTGSRSAPYEVELTINVENETFSFIDGECSCPVGYECKHIVATLLKAKSVLQTEKSLSLNSHVEKPDWSRWFDVFNHSAKKELAAPTDIIAYLVDELPYGRTRALTIRIGKSRILKGGGVGKFQELSLESVVWTRYATALDAEILLLLKKGQAGYSAIFSLTGDESGDILEKVLQTGRAFWKETSEVPLKIAEPRSVTLSWELLSNGHQQLRCEIEGGGTPLPISPPWYIDKDQQECGGLFSKHSLKHLASLLQAPIIAPNQVQDFERSLKENQLDLPAPKTFSIQKKKIKPTLHLHLFGVDTIENYSWREPSPYAIIAPYFVYGETKISIFSMDLSIYQTSKGEVIEINRKIDQENNLIGAFIEPGLVASLDKIYPHKNIDEKYQDCFTVCHLDWSEADQVAATMEALECWRKEGFSITIDPSFPFQCIQGENNWYLDAEVEGQNHWFDLELGIEIEGEKLNLLPILVSLIQNSPEIFNSEFINKMADTENVIVRVPGKGYVQLPSNKIKEVLSTLCELSDPSSLEDGRLKLSKLRLGNLLDMAESLDCEWEGGGSCKDLAKKLKNFKGILNVTPSNQFQADLRPYQKEGLDWLQFLSEYQLGGILADDMGLGKTVQTLAHFCIEKEKTSLPSLVIAPTSLMTNWRRELERFAPHLKALTLHGSCRKEFFSSIPEFDIVFTTYPLLVRDGEELLKYSYHAVVLDEAQTIKNSRAKCAKICRSFESHHRICLTGTPMENHLGELWSLFDFATPGLLGNAKQFKRVFRTPIEKHGSLSLQKSLAKRVAPFMLRRTKAQVIDELPPKTEVLQTIEIEGAQKRLYEGIRLSMHKRVTQALKDRGLASSQILILDALLKLRQVCCDPRLLKLDSAKDVKESAKFFFLTEMLSKLLEEGRKVLLFSSFTSMLRLIEDHLIAHSIPYSKLTGQTKDREKPIIDFQEGKSSLFLISLKAGGVGLNLTAADTVIHYDPWWNPAAENQATDRAYRIGQDKPVFVYKLIVKNTVEEKILRLQEKKKNLMDGLFNQKQKKVSQLTLEDLEDLFEPMTSD